ncbi:unnamed protein product, partial [Mesorhabditis belari]|uniref:Uncharacterized protein n=1 Tax=Mesorhabditis belari TaxID=2138241 RepID=A0AAF3F1V5_9BILA
MLFSDKTTGKAYYNLNVLVPKIICFLIVISLIVFVFSYYLQIRIKTVERKRNSVMEFEPALWREDIDSAIQAAQEQRSATETTHCGGFWARRSRRRLGKLFFRFGRLLPDEPPPLDLAPKTRRRAKGSGQLV